MDTRSAIYHYCNYQERCHAEVRSKLYELGAKYTEVEELIAELIEKDIVNEERYARAIARGKFRLKSWGRIKIVQQLRQDKISDYCIKKALTEIDEDEYISVLRRLAEKKRYELRTEKNPIALKNKIIKYLLQKGFEYNLIADAIKEE